MKILRFAAYLALSAFVLIVGAASSEAQTTPFARVAADGTILASNKVASVEGSGGRFNVNFSESIVGCAIVATTIDDGGAVHLPKILRNGQILNRAMVDIREQLSFRYVNKPFTIAAFCGQTGTFHAVVERNGMVVYGSVGTTASRLSIGRYIVNFPANVGSCAYLAQVGGPNGTSAFSGYTLYVGSASGGDVLVETKTFGGVSADIPFNLGVVCPNAANASSAVVGDFGLINRGSAGTSSFRQSVGSYQLVTNRWLTNCGVLATRGHVAAASPSPGTVQVSAGLAPNLARITARRTASNGGALSDLSFHVAAFCP